MNRPNASRRLIAKKRGPTASVVVASISASRKDLFLEAFARLGGITEASKEIGQNRCTHYEWLRLDPEYAERFRRLAANTTFNPVRQPVRQPIAASITGIQDLAKFKVEYSGKQGVYILAAPRAGRLKVGFSTNVQRRAFELQATSPESLHIVLVLSGATRSVEAQILGILDDHRSHGEWVSCTPAAVSFVYRLCRNAGEIPIDTKRALAAALLSHGAACAADESFDPNPWIDGFAAFHDPPIAIQDSLQLESAS